MTALLLALALGQAKEDIRGEWWCTSMVIDGEKQKLRFVSKIRLTITEKEYREDLGDENLSKFSYERKGEFIRFELPDKTYFYGRVELKDGKLKICYPGPIDGHQPLAPAEFSSPRGEMRNLSTWKRLKE